MRQLARWASPFCAPLYAGALAALALAAAAPAQGIMFTREVRGSVLSDYVFRGKHHSEETLKLAGEVRLNGLHGGAVLIQPFDGDDFASEGRLFAGWSPHVEDRGSPVDYELGFTYYDTLADAPGFPDDNRFEPYAKLFIDAPLMPSIAGYYDTELETYTLEGRLSQYVAMGALNGIELGLDGGYVSPNDDRERAYAQGSVDFVHNFLGGLEGYVGVRGALSSEDTFLSDMAPGGPLYENRAKAWIAAGFSASF